MKILVVGGTGLIGGHAALYLKERGHDVTLMARKPTAVPGLAELPFIEGNYIEDDCSDGRLAGFDTLLFAAAVDIRQFPQDGSVTPEDFYTRGNTEGVPRFFEAAKAAGISRAVYVGSFYPQVAPERIDVCPYVKSRHLADEGVRALADEQFTVCSVNAPFVLGRLEGLAIPHLDAMAAYARGQLADMPVFAPEGGTNHITVDSLSPALAGALEFGESGKAYLVGDENYSWKDYLELWFRLADNEQDIPVGQEDHPLLPNVIMFAGPGATVSYEPDEAETALLGYPRQLVASTVREILAQS